MVATRLSTAMTVLIVPCMFCQNAKTYKHASDYQIAVLDQNLRVATGSDVTLGKNTTDAKLSPGGQGIHLLHTDAGDYRVEAPVNKGLTVLSALGSSASRRANTFHNKWFLDNVQPGSRVLFASECARPNKKHPNDAVRCEFYFPDPDSTDHEYATIGDFTPFMSGDGSNTVKTAGVLCDTGKLKPDVEAELCSPQQKNTAPAAPQAAATVTTPPRAAPTRAPSVAFVGNQRPQLVGASSPRPRPAVVPATNVTAPPGLPVPPAATANEASAAGSASNSVTLSVSVDSNVKGADIEVDGQFVGNTPSTITVSPGQHVIEVSKNGYATWDRSLSVSGNGVHVAAELTPQAKQTTTRPVRSHSLQIRCYPVSACS